MGGAMGNSVHVIGGGTVDRVRQNIALASVSYGETARRVAALAQECWPEADTNLHLTRMASRGESDLETVDDVRSLLKRLVCTESTRAIFLPAALCPFQAGILEHSIPVGGSPDSGTISPRAGQHLAVLTPKEEVVDYVRAYRRELVLVGFTTLAKMTESELAEAAILYAKLHMCNLVVAKDRVERRWALATPDEWVASSTNRDEVLKQAVMHARGLCSTADSGPLSQVSDPEQYEAHP